MGKSPRSAVRVVIAGVVLTLTVSYSFSSLAQLLDPDDSDLMLGRSRLRVLNNWPRTENPANRAVANCRVPVGSPRTADLDAGLSQIEQICSEAGNQYEFSALVTDNFILLHCGNDGWASSTGELLERTYQRFYDTFREAGFPLNDQPSRLTWVCFSNSNDYQKYAWETERRDVSALEGYYSAQTNRVTLYQDTMIPLMAMAPPAGSVVPAAAVNEPLGAAPRLVDAARTTHEAAHQLAFNSGLQRRGVMYPFWLSEGMATAFENDPADTSGASEISARRRRLLDAQALNTLVPFHEFVSMTRIPMDDMGRIYDAYAQAWGFYTFLFENYRPQLTRYVMHLQTLAPGRRSNERIRNEFIQAFGALKPIEKQWALYLNSLESPSR